MNGNGHDAGFTLLEVLVALALTLLIGLALAGAVSFGGRMQDGGVEANTRGQALLAMDRLMRQHLGRALIDAAADGEADFAGTPTALGFITDRPNAAMAPGRYRVLWRLVPDSGGAMALNIRMTRMTSPQAEPADVLLKDLPAGQFAYFGEGPDGRLAWFSQWDGNGVPRLIKLAFEGEKARWPALVARPALFRETAP